MINILVPMAGEGSRFMNAGFSLPKPIIDVKGLSVIEWVVNNLNIPDARYIFCVRENHVDKYALDHMFNQIIPHSCSYEIVKVDRLTEGTAITCLLAQDLINNEDPLVVSLADQYVEDWEEHMLFYRTFRQELFVKNMDGFFPVFNSAHPKWGYVRTKRGFYSDEVVEVREKTPISRMACTGIYAWKNGKDFVHYTKKMIEKNIRVNDEFFISPAYSLAIEDGKRFSVVSVNKFWGLGDPESLNYFLLRGPNP